MDEQIGKAIFLLKDLYSDETVAAETGLPLAEIKRIRQAHRLAKQRVEFIQTLHEQMEVELPRLFKAAAQELERLINSPRTSNRDKLTAIRLVSDLLHQSKA